MLDSIQLKAKTLTKEEQSEIKGGASDTIIVSDVIEG